MRIAICVSLLFACLAVIPSVHCDRKYKLAEYNERDKQETKERYSQRDDDQRYRKNKFRKSSDEDVTVKRHRREESDEEPQINRKKFNRKQDEEKVRKNRSRKVQEEEEESEEGFTDESEDVCVDKRGRKCRSEETDEDDTDEDDSGDRNWKRVTYVKKFAHEKTKQKQDKETGNVMKLHKRDERRRGDNEDDSSEEEFPKRRRFVADGEE